MDTQYLRMTCDAFMKRLRRCVRAKELHHTCFHLLASHRNCESRPTSGRVVLMENAWPPNYSQNVQQNANGLGSYGDNFNSCTSVARSEGSLCTSNVFAHHIRLDNVNSSCVDIARMLTDF
ncbi:hypothetical protein ANCCEY_08984 [Ancylostoma ceylanicum]|uniref:Uncharacterized protein n=1 Tax=Ancylostoma ceylanicum TaxID=53326 RepID=A0A0D6LL86_9BILA|nr:hypothetical protein ANCCEY_08984 [Ancylostoma ceylanicum]